MSRYVYTLLCLFLSSFCSCGIFAVTAYGSPICDDYPYGGTWAGETRCLWFGNREFRSYMVTCDD
ncbi:hypothetical protein V8F06_007773, partial [Rhypophila decipiens]